MPCLLKIGSFEVVGFREISPAGRGAESHESIEGLGGVKAIHPEAGRARCASCRGQL